MTRGPRVVEDMVAMQKDSHDGGSWEAEVQLPVHKLHAQGPLVVSHQELAALDRQVG